MTVSSNTEIVTRSFEGFESSDMEKFTSDRAPDIVFDVSGLRALAARKHVWVFTDQGRAKAFSQEVSG